MKKKKEIEPKVITFETFKQLGTFDVRNLEDKEPSCFNGFVRVKKYRVTIELIEEPKEAYAERLQKLWDESNNHHDYVPLENAAAALGVELQGSRGSKAKPKNY